MDCNGNMPMIVNARIDPSINGKIYFVSVEVEQFNKRAWYSYPDGAGVYKHDAERIAKEAIGTQYRYRCTVTPYIFSRQRLGAHKWHGTEGWELLIFTK